jgi:hypothetical protein
MCSVMRFIDGDEPTLRAKLADYESRLSKALAKSATRRFGLAHETLVRDLKCSIEALKRPLAGEPQPETSYGAREEQRQLIRRPVDRPRSSTLPRW